MPDQETKTEKKEEQDDPRDEVKEEKTHELETAKLPQIPAGDRGLWETD